jgi:hypothetical protein
MTKNPFYSISQLEIFSVGNLHFFFSSQKMNFQTLFSYKKMANFEMESERKSK